MIYVQLFFMKQAFMENRSNSPSNYDPEGLILLSPALESSDDGCALPHLGLGSHEHFFFLSSQAIDGE